MSKEFTAPDPVELVREQLEALDRGDLDGVMSSVAEDGVLDGRAELIEGRAAISGFLEEWFGAYEELDFELEEVSHLGGGVVFAVVIQDGRLVGSDGHVRQREGWVYLCVGARSLALRPPTSTRPARPPNAYRRSGGKAHGVSLVVSLDPPTTRLRGLHPRPSPHGPSPAG